MPNAAIEQSIASRLEQKLFSRYGLVARYETHEDLPGIRKSNPLRFFSKFEFTIGYSTTCQGGAGIVRDGKAIIFVKRGPLAGIDPQLESALTQIPRRFFNTPHFLAHMNICGEEVAAWTFTFGHSPRFDPQSMHLLRRIVDGVAGINASTPGVLLKCPNLRVQTPWVEPLADKINSLLDDYDGTGLDVLSARIRRRVRRHVRVLKRTEADLIERFRCLGNCFLTHHDLKFENVILPDEGPVVFVDWTSASVSAPGTGLRFLAKLKTDIRLELTKQYVNRMAEMGYKLEIQDIMFAIEAHQLFWGFSTGVKRKSLRRIYKTLRQVDTSLPKIEERYLTPRMSADL